MAYCDGKAKATAMGACNNCSLHAALNCIDLGWWGGGGDVISLKDVFNNVLAAKKKRFAVKRREHSEITQVC